MYGCSAMRRSSRAISCGGRTRSTKPERIALRGIASNFALSSVCAKVKPPAALIARNPAVPSLPVPESTMPIARDPRSSASDSKKMIDRDVESLRAADQSERAILRDHAFVRRLDVNSVWFWRSRSRYFAYRHRRHFAEQIRKPTGVMWIEMLHNHKSHAGSRRQIL